MDCRGASLERLQSRQFDLLVIGAGIVGARVAYEAAGLGMSVALVDAGDFGGGTSSVSSKMLHGGFRYLARLHLGLVREAQRERGALAERVAPHLVRPCPLVVAVPRNKPAGGARLATGIALYDALSGFQSPRPRLLTRPEAARLVPALDPRAVGAVALVHEAQVHDARLTLATVEGAARAGAVVVNYARVVSLEGKAALAEDVLGGDLAVVRFRSVVNAAGPWLDQVRRLADPWASPLVRLSKGVQAFLPLPAGWQAGLAVFDERRSAFALEWEGLMLLGVTDEPYADDPSEVSVGADSIGELRASLAPLLPGELLDPSRVLSASVGLRVLPRGRGRTADAPREHVIETSASGMVSIGGGKLTTHRLIALRALRSLPSEVRPRRLVLTDAALPGSSPAPRLTGVDTETARHLIATYGSRAGEVAAYARDDPSLLDRIHPEGPDVWAQARFAVEREWAVTADDVLLRRTTAGWRGRCDGDLEAELAERTDTRVQLS